MADLRREERGFALPTAVVAALIVSITALVVLNFSMRRFELSMFRTDRALTLAASEAGFEYAFVRLGNDPALEAAVRADADVYLVSPLAVGTRVTLPYDGANQLFTVDEQDPALQMDRPVHVMMEEFAEVPAVNPPRLRIHAYSDYGTGA